MKSIGQILKEARLKKKLSLVKVENETKIKKEFIEYIEEENWAKLPTMAVVLGFIKSLAGYLKIDQAKAVAVFKRDYPPHKNLQVNPKPDVASTFVWSPKFTFLVGAGSVLILILAYLGLQYRKFTAKPSLTIYSPKEEEVIKTYNLTVFGKTDSDATVKVNNQPALIAEDGSFQVEINIYSGTTQIEVKAMSRSGKETILARKIVPELE
jgi:cytoskeletal protein RodZ